PSWGSQDLYLPPDAERDALYRYFSYLIGESFGRSPRVMFKENRLAFRLGWFRRHFPAARIVHIYRRKEAQWRSMVRRGQLFVGREDIGQDRVDFAGFNLAAFCEDLKATFPELDARHFTTGFERFSRLWELSYQHNRRYADVSIDYDDLVNDFEATFGRVWEACGAPPIDISRLRAFVVKPDQQPPARRGLRARLDATTRKLLWHYARARVRLQA